MDKIIISELEIYGYHGVNEEEKINGQRFILDIELSLDLTAPCLSDNIDDTVSYAKIIKLASAVFNEEKNDLIERAARRIADAVLAYSDKIALVRVLLRKPDAPIKAKFGYVAVDITVQR